MLLGAVCSIIGLILYLEERISEIKKDHRLDNRYSQEIFKLKLEIFHGEEIKAEEKGKVLNYITSEAPLGTTEDSHPLRVQAVQVSKSEVINTKLKEIEELEKKRKALWE